MKRLTPVLVVDAIEPSLPFWAERLGFEQTAQVPHGDRLGFVALRRGDVEVMLQTVASVADDVPDLADDLAVGGTALFVEVDDLDAIDAALEGVERPIPRRTTFYGADEIVVRDPGGHVVTFAQFDDSSA